jgi:hypothetical protein
MRNASLGSHRRDEVTWRWTALLVPVILLALIGTVCTGKYLTGLTDELAGHGGPSVTCTGGQIINTLFLSPSRPQDLLCLELAFTPDNASAVFAAWSLAKTGMSDAAALTARLETAKKIIRVDWLLILCYSVGLSAFGLLLMWLLRYEQHTFAPVLLCCPLVAGMLDVAENLCMLEMLASPEHPGVAAAALGGAASSVKWALLLVVVPIAVVWALLRLPRRARSARQVVEAFPAVLAAERAYIAERRKLAGTGEEVADQTRLRPIGLTLSGGGIRSATFNLGVLQALSRLGILPYVDYLSTVSGGGYIGSCLTSLLSHPSSAKLKPDSRIFKGGEAPYFTTHKATFPFNANAAEQPALSGFDGRDQLRHLRTHGDFLIARRTLLSRDTLRAVGNTLGSTLYHVLVALLFLVSVAGIYLAIVGLMVGDLVSRVAPLLASPRSYAAALFDAGPPGFSPFVSAVLAGIFASALGLCLGMAVYVVPAKWLDSEGQSEEESRGYLALWAIFWVTIATAVAVSWWWIRGHQSRLAFLTLPLGVYVGGQLTSFVLYPIVSIPSRISRDDRSRFAGAHGLFTYLNVISLVVVTFPYVIVALLLWRPEGKTAFAWLLSLVVARLLASGPTQKTPGGAAGVLGWLRGLAPPMRQALLSALATLLVVGGVILLCVWILQLTPGADPVRMPLAVGLTALGLFVLLGVALDFNKLSLHYFYRDRLAETYLQTFAPPPDGARVEVSRRDDSEMPLTELLGKRRDAPGQRGNACVTSAPYHLLMAALNLTASRDMTRRDRKSDYFVFSKLYCGSESTGYMTTDGYRSGETKLARAMTISGAAASSAAGAQTFLAQSFALTLLGVRLGQWMENPRFRDGRRANRNEGGVFWPFYLMREMIGSTDASRRLVNLSDGGHTGDNVGICPLLKRRCAVIIACDAEADPQSAFGSLTEALRQIYIDENIRVEINLDRLRPDPVTKRSAGNWAIGTIYYPQTVGGGEMAQPADTGYLLVLKSSFVGGVDDSEPVKNYRQEHPEFPHETTADQFFDDDQFESYRELGEQIALRALSAVSDLAWRPEQRDTWTAVWDTQARIGQAVAG